LESPPANNAIPPTDVATRKKRAMLREAVDQTRAKLQLVIDWLPSPAVVNPTGHGVQPKEFLNEPLAQGVKKASTFCTSASESFTLYTSKDWTAKSEGSPGM
jgi:hypothetical protein